MLTRSFSRIHNRQPCPVQPKGLPTWLRASGSLTARLQALGHVQVLVHKQGAMKLLRQEQRALGVRSGHVREVTLLVDGCPAVWARSCTTHQGAKGAWQAIKGLGHRPLAALLFSDYRVSRSALSPCRVGACSPLQHHTRQAIWLATSGTTHSPTWARHSVFWRKGQPLQVLEAFAPWVGWHTTPADRFQHG